MRIQRDRKIVVNTPLVTKRKYLIQLLRSIGAYAQLIGSFEALWGSRQNKELSIQAKIDVIKNSTYPLYELEDEILCEILDYFDSFRSQKDIRIERKHIFSLYISAS
jgi:hypothetical protein